MISAGAKAPELDAARLRAPVRLALGSTDADVLEWTCTPLTWAPLAPTTAGLYRVAGSARVRGGRREWSLVLKVIKSLPDAVVVKSAPGYWRREADAYASGELADLAGVSAPRCFGTEDGADGEAGVWLWLEHAREVEEHWSLAQYARAATNLGIFTGSYLGPRALPHVDWLSRGWLRWWTERISPVTARVVADPATWTIPLVRRAFPSPLADRILALIQRAPRLLDSLDALPPTLCHHDAWRSNLLAARGTDGAERTVLIDWSFAGAAAPGVDAGILLAGSHFWLHADAAQIEAFDREVFEAYLAGVAEQGSSPREQVRFAYAATAALWGGLTAPVWLPRWGDPARRGWLESRFGRSLDDAVEPYARVLDFMLDLGDEAWALLPVRA